MEANQFEPKITKLKVEAGDTVVYMHEHVLPQEAISRIKAGFAPLLPEGVKVMVLDGGASLAVLSSRGAA